MTRIRLVTLNVAHGRGLSPYQGLHSRRALERNLERIAGLLRELHADVVALQEVDENSRWAGAFDHLEHLRRAAGYPYAVWGINNRRAGRFHLSYGNALLSRHPITTWENVIFGAATVGEKGFLFAEIDLQGRALPVVNLHFHFGSRRRRLAQLEILTGFLSARSTLRAMHWHAPPVICGDFNTPVHHPDAAAALLRHLNVQSPYTVHPLHQRTFPSPWPRRTLDHVFLPEGCPLVHCEVVRTFVSDHRPVLVDFRLGALAQAAK